MLLVNVGPHTAYKSMLSWFSAHNNTPYRAECILSHVLTPNVSPSCFVDGPFKI